MSKPAPSVTLQLEALLFVANEPLSSSRLADLTGADETTVRRSLTDISAHLDSRGWRLACLDDRYQLVTAPEADVTIRQYLQAETRTELSRAALETLAIIAYRGPITRLALEEIRGVASDTMLRNLLQRGLITEAGRSTEPGRPVRYNVSHGFLQHLGLTSLADLPPLPETTET
jgi:segregation and condensation protein B